MMDSLTTRPSLLVRLRDVNDAKAWEEFVELYAPLIHRFCRKRGLQDADAADLTQDVLGRVCRAFPAFEYDPGRGSFRGWLFTAVRNRLRDVLDQDRRRPRGSGQTSVQLHLNDVPSREHGLEDEWEQEYRRQLYATATRTVRRDVTASTWAAFQATVIGARPAAAVAAELGLSVAAVYLAKSRVMARLKAEIRQWDEGALEGALP